MKHITILLTILLSSTAIFGQEKTEKPSISFYGFLRTELATDTHRGVASLSDIFYLLPIGGDANEDFQSHLSAAASRLGTKIAGPEILNAKTSAVIEFDFGGVTSTHPNLFRMRKAYTNFAWEKSSLLVGQTWHPMWGDEHFPMVGNLNTGAPFQAFNRSPQVRFNYKVGKATSLSAAAVYENQYTSKAFYSITTDIDKTKAQRYAGVPEFTLSLIHRQKNWSAGVVGEMKTILPTDTTIYGTKNSLTKHSFGATAFGSYKKDKLYVLVKGMVGQDMAHLTTPGGYGVKNITANGEFEYTNYTNGTAYINAVYGKKWQVGTFLGYGKNFGTSEALIKVDGKEKVAGLFTTVQDMYRASAHVALNVKNFRLVAEYELTSANYGQGVMDLSNGLYNDTFNATNHRTVLVATYSF